MLTVWDQYFLVVMKFFRSKMIGPVMDSNRIIIRLLLLTFIGVTGIQNEPTSSRAFRDELVLSASSFEAARPSSFVSFREKDDDVDENLRRTHPAVELESSKGVEINGKGSSQAKLEISSQDSGLDAEMTASQRFEEIDENNIEVKAPKYYEKIVPTQTELSGEGQGAPQAHTIVAEPRRPSGSVPLVRQGRQETPMIYNDDRIQSSMQTDAPSKRQANPDIQDIITGIVKLLNGNVNVAVNTIRPHKPVQATRINNRGPPRISDLPPLPLDFDTPGMNPPPPPLPDQPYPFETPPAPEKPSINQLPPVPDRSPARPYIPGIPLSDSIKNRPWNNRPQRPANRRPIPPYKPLPSPLPTTTDSNDEQQNTSSGPSSLNRDESTTLQSNHMENKTEPSLLTTKTPPYKFQPPLKQQKINTASTLILGADLHPIPIPSRTENVINTAAPSANTTQFDISTLKIETSSSVQVIEPTRTTIEIQPSIVTLESNHKSSVTVEESRLEPSKNPQIISSSTSTASPTPTEGLTINPSSTTESSSNHHSSLPNTYSYRPRPGIVLDDTLDYTKTLGFATQRPYSPPRRHPQIGDIFDVTVSAIQGPGGGEGGPDSSVRVSLNGGGEDVILTSAVEGQGFVSIDGKRTHLNLFDNTPVSITPTKSEFKPTRTQAPGLLGTGYAVPQTEEPQQETPSKFNYKPPPTERRRPPFFRKTTTDAVRIDTCIVGDSSTCDASQHEACATVQGVSACHCKPGYARLIRTLPCKRVISIVVSIRVDRIYDTQIVWANDLTDRNSEAHQQIAYESNRAIESAMSMTPFSDEYMGSSINSIYQGDVSQGQGGVFVNATLKLTYEPRTARQSLASELQKHLLGVIHRRNNNIGNSALFVNSPAGSISNLQDLDECASSEHNDCHSSALCANTWGGFTCSCKPGLKDPHKEDIEKAGRSCLSCSPSHCNNRGTCSYQGSIEQCSCTGNYYGVKCEIDGEVVAVAIGASVAALIIIILTLVCLVMWSRRWSREQKAAGSSPVYGYMQGTMPGTLARVGSMGTLASVKQGGPSTLPPYLWGHMADHIAAANLYASEPMGPTRPSSAVFGYPTMNVHGTLPPVPLPRLQAPPRSRPRHQPEPDSSDSDQPQDKDRADLIPQNNGFHVPRPKSRSSLANQSGIYYDVEYDQGDFQHLSKNNIPMSTYSMARPYYRT